MSIIDQLAAAGITATPETLEQARDTVTHLLPERTDLIEAIDIRATCVAALGMIRAPERLDLRASSMPLAFLVRARIPLEIVEAAVKARRS